MLEITQKPLFKVERCGVERESMEFDVVVVGAGPAGLSAAIRLMQLAESEGRETTVCVVEKGSEVGAHILSGAVLEPRALNELIPDWQERGAPLNTPVTGDTFYFYTSEHSAIKLPGFAIPRPTHNDGNYIVSMGNVCRWLAEQAEGMGIEIYPGFTASEILFDDEGAVKGIATGEMGVGADGQQKDSYVPSMELHARYTVFAEGCRGHLGKQLISHFSLDDGRDPQHYGIGIKEVWKIDPEKHQEGLVVHGIGWPLSESNSSGGAFLYHAENHEVYLGLIADLNYSNPHLSPFEEFQRWKTHPKTKEVLEGGERIAYGARALAKGGQNSLPEMAFPGGILVGCDAGTLNSVKIKGNHTAMKSGMLAAEAAFDQLQELTEDERDEFISCSDPAARGILAFFFYTGCRLSEGFRLRGRDLRDGQVTVWSRKGKAKKKKVRQLPILHEVAVHMKPSYSPSELIFPDPNGNEWTRQEFYRYFNRVVADLSIEDFVAHDMRHTYASHLVQKGVNLVVLQQLLGHETLEMVKRYAHLAPNNLTEAAQVLSKVA